MPGQPRINDKLIVDIGACEGNDTSFYLRKGFDVVAVEANPRNYADITARFAAEIADGRLIALNRAAYSSSGSTVDVWDTQIAGHSNVGANAHRAASSFAVSTIDYADLIEVAGVPRYMKIDIEGSEDAFLSRIKDGDPIPEFTSVECHEFQPIDRLRQMGYRRFKLINQAMLHFNPIPNPPLEGVFVDDTNHMHGSGLFGREAPGDWYDFETVTDLFAAIAKLRAKPEIMRAWFDCHAWAPREG